MGIMENWSCVGVIVRLYEDYTGRMENEIETTIWGQGLGLRGILET